jgi:uncharacterized lipoprotein YmbA
LRKTNLTPLFLLCLAVLSALWLAGCGSLLDTQRPVDKRYWLEPLAASGGGSLDGLELSFELTAVPGLDSERVLLLGPDARLAQLGQARWADSLPDVLQSVLARSLSNAGANRVDAGGRTDCHLQLEVQRFFARGAPPSDVAVSMAGRFECRGANLPVRVEARAHSGPGDSAVVAALQAALDQSTRDLLDRLERLSKPDTTE